MTNCLSNAEVKEIFTAFYNKWYLPYSNKETITYHDLDTMYEVGKGLVEHYPNDLAMALFVNLFRVIEGRRVNGTIRTERQDS